MKKRASEENNERALTIKAPFFRQEGTDDFINKYIESMYKTKMFKTGSFLKLRIVKGLMIQRGAPVLTNKFIPILQNYSYREIT